MSSQGREDQILESIFAKIGITNRYAVECGARDGVRGSNTHALRLQGWTCLLLDAAPRSRAVHRVFLTAENLEATFERYRVPPVFDLLSIDVDGNDFWLWRALRHYVPRVVVIEYNSRWGSGESRVIPYRADQRWDRTDYYGASAAALVTLGTQKGYTLVGVVPQTNLVFVRAETGLAACPVPPAAPCVYPVTRRPWEVY